MNKTLANIYALIMLECRLPLEEASKIFRISKETLDKAIKTRTRFSLPYKYLEIECASYPEGLAKAKLKASLYLRQLQRILKVQDKTERIKLLNEFITALSGPNINFSLIKKSHYTKEEKESILKYRLKYALSNQEIYYTYNIGHSTISRWENNLSDNPELKIRLEILRNYLNYGYQCYQQSVLNK